ncbi:hypothetical protein BN131_1355 [Cronobacter malonaticus 681]|nr:hypothetical protein BN131_1355 [Cronobacter malonaticus 681]
MRGGYGPDLACAQHRAAVDSLRRIRRTHADFPLAVDGRETLARQRKARDLGLHRAVAKPVAGSDRHEQRCAPARSQVHLLGRLCVQAHQPAGAKGDVKLLRLFGQVCDIQRQARGIAARQETRRAHLGNHRCRHNHFAFTAAEAVVAPGLRHHAQFAVKVADRQRNRTFTLVVQLHRHRLFSDDSHMVDRRFAAAVQLIAVATKAQCRQTALSFNDLAVDIVDIRAIAFLAKEATPRIRRDVVGDVKHAAVYGGNQHVDLLRQLAVFHAGFHFHRQRAVRAHLRGGFQRQIETTVFITHRQMQQADRAFLRRGAGFIARTHHQRAEIEIVALPGFIHRNVQIEPFLRHVDLLPPQRAFRGFHHRIAFACGWRGDVQLDSVARLIERLINFQRHTVRARRAGTVVVILPAVTRPEAHAADEIVRRDDFQTIGTPLHREADFAGFTCCQIDSLLGFHQIFLIELRQPAFRI